VKGGKQMKSIDNVIEEYGDMVTRICIMNLRNSQDAKDCFQDVFIKLYNHDDFESHEHLKAWLIRVTMNTCKDYQRRFYKHVIDIDEVIICDHHEELQLLPILLTLHDKYKNVMYLYYYEGYKIHEISEILHIKENTIKSRLKRGRKILKTKLGDEYHE